MRNRIKSVITIKQSTTYRSEAIEAYFRDINKYRLLTADEETELMTAYKNGDEKAGEKIVLANLRFVVSVAKQYDNLGVPLLDLISVGSMGLLDAIRRFDDTRGFRFISYAVWWIRQAVLGEIARNSNVIRVPNNMINKNYKHYKETGVNLPEIAKLHAVSLSTPIKEGETGELGDTIASVEFEDPSDVEFENNAVRFLLNKLDDREQVIFKLKYGIDCEREHTYAEIAEKLGNSIQADRVMNIHNRALYRLKSRTRSVKSQLIDGLKG